MNNSSEDGPYGLLVVTTGWKVVESRYMTDNSRGFNHTHWCTKHLEVDRHTSFLGANVKASGCLQVLLTAAIYGWRCEIELCIQAKSSGSSIEIQFCCFKYKHIYLYTQTVNVIIFKATVSIKYNIFFSSNVVCIIAQS